jgi:hypothetical protein
MLIVILSWQHYPLQIAWQLDHFHNVKRRSTRYIVLRVNVPTIHQCAEVCLSLNLCKSLNFDKKNKICHIATKTWMISTLEEVLVGFIFLDRYFMCMFCRSFFVLLYFFFWPLCCLFFFDIRILITPDKKNKICHIATKTWMISTLEEDNDFLYAERYNISQISRDILSFIE